MAPILFKCSFFTIYTYGVFVALAFLVAVPLWVREGERRGLDGERIYTLGLLLLASGVVGARLLYVAMNWGDFSGDLLEIVRLQHGGLAWFGGFAAATSTLIVYAGRQRWSPTAVLDSVAPFVALGQGIGRIGCLFNGCCHGAPVAWGLYFKVYGTRLFPTQLVSALTLMAVALVLARCQRRQTRPGTVAAWYLVGAGLQRFLMEFIRADIRPYFLSLSVFQWMALGVMLVGFIVLGIIRWRREAV